jgi:hypothetical protein
LHRWTCKIVEIDYTNDVKADILERSVKYSLIINIVNDGLKVVLGVNFPHFHRKLIHSDKIDTKYDDKAEHILNENWMYVNTGIRLGSESLKSELSVL